MCAPKLISSNSLVVLIIEVYHHYIEYNIFIINHHYNQYPINNK